MKLQRRLLHVARIIEDMRGYHHLNRDKRIGYVPTMGALHNGHLTLMQQAKRENDLVVASVFVNPTQFSAGEDFDRYPRDLDSDIKMLKSIGVDCVFAPETDEIYSKDRLCHVEASAFSHIYEGQLRPEFFRGVATIVCKLFNIVQPTTAYFGQKDVSQCILIRKMVDDLNMPVKIKVIETIRDADGLALSSRNAYLTPEERKVSNILYLGLQEGRKHIEANFQHAVSSKEVIKLISDKIMSEPFVKRIEYVSIASHINMAELSDISLKTGAVISSAIRLGNVRLIDNILIGKANDLLQ